MAHGHRFMQQVGPHHWVVRCRVCPKRFGKAEFETARDCHDWWRSHEASEFHAKSVDAIPAKRERALRLAEGCPRVTYRNML